MRCATHPGVETALRCSKCGRPICPKCMVETAVGARCPECARLYRLPTFQVNTRYLLIAVGAGLGTAIVYGLIWGAIGSFLNFFPVNPRLPPVGRSSRADDIRYEPNSTRVITMASIAAWSVVRSYLFSAFPPWWLLFLPLNITRLVLDLLALALGIYVAVSRLR